MSKREDLIALRQMLDHAERVARTCSSKSRQDLETDEVLSAAVIRWIEIIGEAATRLTKETRTKHPEIPWAQVISTRNRLIHAYDEIDFDILWDTVRHDIPDLIQALKRIIGDQS